MFGFVWRPEHYNAWKGVRSICSHLNWSSCVGTREITKMTLLRTARTHTVLHVRVAYWIGGFRVCMWMWMCIAISYRKYVQRMDSNVFVRFLRCLRLSDYILFSLFIAALPLQNSWIKYSLWYAFNSLSFTHSEASTRSGTNISCFFFWKVTRNHCVCFQCCALFTPYIKSRYFMFACLKYRYCEGRSKWTFTR